MIRFLELRRTRWSVALLVFGGLFYSFGILARSNSPYEDWDEVATFNNAAVMWSPLRHRTYAYGFLDTAKMALGRRMHEGPLQPGICMGEPTYSNNVPDSLSSGDFDVSGRQWIGLSAIDFNYFRGLVDRHGLFYARLINIACLLLLVVAILLALEALLGGAGMAIGSLGLLWFMSCYEFAAQATQALPNAASALLALLTTLLCSGALLRDQWRWVVWATIPLGLGINHKIDFVVLALPVVVTATVLAFQQRNQRGNAVKMILLAGLCLSGSVIFTNPYLLEAPVAEIGNQVRVVRSLSSATVDVASNWSNISPFFHRQFSTSTGGSHASLLLFWSGVAYWVISASLLPIAGPRGLARHRSLVFALLATTGALLLLIPIYRSTALYHRYFLNGASVLMLLPIFGLALATKAGTRLVRVTAGILAAILIVIVALRAVSLRQSVAEINIRTASNPDLDSSHSRNRAVQHVIDHLPRANFSKKVLIDQHGYFDLAALRTAGLDPIFVNCINWSERIRALPHGNYILVAVSGDYEIEPRWLGLWEHTLRAQYDTYIREITALPVLFRTGTARMKLLDWKPPAPDDLVIIAELTIVGVPHSP